ncbi:hypothetical protein BDZ91DRAFT_741582 [Kalaharituber pfeilii]|nr:hypothetical protein BDZ91DRAFT_741582 [Kalaharituber pfeilii]
MSSSDTSLSGPPRFLTRLLPFVLCAVQLVSTVTAYPPFSRSADHESLPLRISTRSNLAASAPANIHLNHYPPRLLDARSEPSTDLPAGSSISVTFGSCDASNPTDAHHHIANTIHPDKQEVDDEKRLIWLIPKDVPPEGCISAWDSSTGRLVGRSPQLYVEEDGMLLRKRRLERRGIPMTNETGIDASGPWFDGVLALKSLNLTEVDVKKAKQKKIGILGGGMSGLMTSLLLDSAGLNNWHILEASDRIGGRVRTHHFARPEEYQYQEMGPMRFPVSIHSHTLNLTIPFNDHKLVFSLATKLNELNRQDPKYAVKFIPWYQSSPNGNNLVYMGGIRKPDGTVPTMNDIAENPDLAYKPDNGVAMESELEHVGEVINEHVMSPERMRDVAENMFRAHKQFIDEGLDDFSEFAYVHNLLGASLNASDLLGAGAGSFWTDLFENTYFSATTWKTIDQGLQRLPDAFQPLLKNRISYGRKVSKTSWDNKKKLVKVHWKHDWTDKKFNTDEFDYAVVAVPFSITRGWRFEPALPSLISRAVSSLGYASICKYHRRPGVGSFCYPSYALNSTLPGVLLASYSGFKMADTFLAVSDSEHAKYILDAMAEIHGDIVYEQYTGKFNRLCWMLDQYTRVGDHKLYIPEYFKTVNGMVWVGEHTSYTHAWIASALESAIRGTVQLLLELGLVDEAKEITKEWMGRWLKV